MQATSCQQHVCPRLNNRSPASISLISSPARTQKAAVSRCMRLNALAHGPSLVPTLPKHGSEHGLTYCLPPTDACIRPSNSLDVSTANSALRLASRGFLTPLADNKGSVRTGLICSKKRRESCLLPRRCIKLGSSKQPIEEVTEEAGQKWGVFQWREYNRPWQVLQRDPISDC